MNGNSIADRVEDEEFKSQVKAALLGLAAAIGRLDILEQAGFELKIVPYEKEQHEPTD